MKPFLDKNFILNNEVAQRLYHDHVRDLPIIDYHNHLSPEEIATDKAFNITEVWLKGDHYKWRAMRANGIDEAYITGNTTDEEKFMKWAATVPKTLRNPLYHWTHLELQRYFGINDLLSSDNAADIYAECNRQLHDKHNHAKGLLSQMKVEVVCTTDEPTDSLEHHITHANKGNYTKLLPTFRPDKYLVVNNPHFESAIEKLEKVNGSTISSYDDLLHALKGRIEFFHKNGCRLADHGLSHLYKSKIKNHALDSILNRGKTGQPVNEDEQAFFAERIMIDLAHVYHEKEWTMQLHLGAIRNNNGRLLQLVGADVGCDSIGDYPQAETLSYFLNTLDTESKLPKTILYNLNPRDNEVFATMAGNFNDGQIAGKVQWGSAWWFLDQKDGMEKQLNALSNMGLLSQFIGMLTDSRSFLSFPRHEYFRRLLCNLIGNDVAKGELPNDESLLTGLVTDICYHNARKYFNF